MGRSIEIAPDRGRIVDITSKLLEFVDESGAVGSVELRIHTPNAFQLPPMYIAIRELNGAPWTVTFRDAPTTRFVFQTYEDAYSDLLIPLGDIGLKTFDGT